MKLRLSHCSIRRSLGTVQRFRLCGPGVHSPCDPRHMNPSELAGWPGTHSPCSPRPSRQVISSADGTSWRSIRCLSPSFERQSRTNCKRSIRHLPPSLERQTRARGQVPDRPLAQRRLPGAATITDGGTPVRQSGGRDSSRTRRRIRWALRAPCKFYGSAENLLRCRVLQATDPGPSPERVSAFPSSGEGPGPVACPQRVSAIPSSGKGAGSAAMTCRPWKK